MCADGHWECKPSHHYYYRLRRRRHSWLYLILVHMWTANLVENMRYFIASIPKLWLNLSFFACTLFFPVVFGDYSSNGFQPHKTIKVGGHMVNSVSADKKFHLWHSTLFVFTCFLSMNDAAGFFRLLLKNMLMDMRAFYFLLLWDGPFELMHRGS